MQNIREILRLKYGVGLSHEQIGGALGLSKSVVTKYVGLANEQKLGWPLPVDLDGDDALMACLVPPKPVISAKAQLDYAYIHKELGRDGVTLQLLWEEYAVAQGVLAYKYSRYCDLYRQWCGRQQRSMHQQHIAGEKLFIDYSGPTVDVINQATGEIRAAQIFVAVLGASSYTYAEATWSQSLADWVTSHIHTFEFMGGVTKLLIPDNLRSAITKACRYVPKSNDTYADLARHYDTAILPARPYKPKDKAKAEVGVQVVQRWILARLRHQQFFSLGELNHAIARLLPELNDRTMKPYGQSRRERFEAIDKPALRPLPKNRYEYAEHKIAKVAIDYHIEVNKRLYSVPHQLVGSKVDVRISSNMVQINHKGKQVALHQRHGPGRFSTCIEHMPKSHQKHAEWTPSRFLSWAQSIGPSTHTVVTFQLTDRPHPEHGYRACLGILNLARRYSKSRLEDACTHAVRNRSMYYDSLTSILKKGLDQQPLPGMETTHEDPLSAHDNVRGADYYT